MPVPFTKKSIVTVTSWMVGRYVERFKIVVVEFNFGAVQDAVAHGLKKVFKLSCHLSDGMQGAPFRPRRGEGA